MKKKETKQIPVDGPDRLISHIDGLDILLNGGFGKGGMYLLLGPAGSGKTILANQIGFNHAKNDQGRVLFVTILAESHARMMGNLKSLKFFEPDLIGKSIDYMSGYNTLET